MMGKSILSYQGPLSFSTIDWLLSEFKLAAQQHDLPFRVYKKMISIMIEALENMTKYGHQVLCDSHSEPEYCPSFQINRNSARIELITRNPVKRSDVRTLRARIDRVNKRDSEQLKELYKTTITNGRFSPGGGAGLGFIEIARTAGNKLEYSFDALPGDYYMYTLKVFMDL